MKGSLVEKAIAGLDGTVCSIRTCSKTWLNGSDAVDNDAA